MKPDTAIHADHLGKVYNLYAHPMDRLKEALNWRGRNYHQEFHALRDVSFDITRGETVGIIGRNGSGKSTLLKILAGVLTPSEGHTEVHGRVSSLLELGTGFNPELTGMENIFFQGTLMGFSRSEMQERLDGILSFADIGDFIHHPVKKYSSGMFVRLAFACAVNVDPDILIIDEALAVGDAIFVQKCMRFIRTFRKTGTLLLVSHDMNAIINLCSRAVWLASGQIHRVGKARAIAEAYLQDTLQNIYGSETTLRPVHTETASSTLSLTEANQDASENTSEIYAPEYGSLYHAQNNLAAANGWKSGIAEITSVEIQLMNGERPQIFEGGEAVKLTIKAVAHANVAKPILGFIVRDRLGQDLFGENTALCSVCDPLAISAGHPFEGEFVFHLPMLPNGTYILMASLADGDLDRNVQHHLLHDAIVINVSSSRVRWGLVGISFHSVQLRRIK